MNSSHQSTSTTPQPSSTQQSSSQQSAISPIIIDPEIITSRPHTPITSPIPTERQRSRRSTPIVELPIAEPAQSQHSTPIVEPSIAEPAQSQHSTSIVRRISFDNRSPFNNIEAMLIKQGKQIRILYELQKTSIEKISWLQTQVKKLNSDKDNELSSKVFNVSNNLVCIILSHLDI